MKPQKRVTVPLDYDLWLQLRQAAADAGPSEGHPVSVSEIVRRALVAWLSHERKAA